MSKIYIKKSQDGFVEVIFNNSQVENYLVFDSWEFTHKRKEEVNLLLFDELENIENNFFVKELRSFLYIIE